MPETIGFIIVSAVFDAAVAGSTISVLGASVSVAQIVGTVVVVGGSIGLQYALSSKAEPKPQDGQIITRQAIPPRRRAYGRVKLAGPLLLSETVGGVNARRHQLVALNHGEIDAFEEHWLSSFMAEFTIGDDGGVSNLYQSPGGGDHVVIFWRLGTASQTAYADLVSRFPTKWTSAHQANGIASALIETLQPFDQEDFTTIFPGGLAPPYRAVIRASKVWDPREGGQDKDDPATWTWTRNPVLIALDFHRHADGMGLAPLDDVYFTSAAITEDWIPAADICDDPVEFGNARYWCSGSYSLPDDDPASVLSAILATCDGQPYERSDGAIGIRVGKIIDPTVTLDDEHILGYDGFKKGDNAFLACNEVTAKFTSGDHDYQETDADPWRDEDDIDERGQVITKSLALHWVVTHPQARRLMKLAHKRFNPEWQGRIVTDLAGFAVRNERYLHLTIDELGIDGSFEITSFEASIGSDATTCSIGVISLDQSAFDFDFDTEGGTTPPLPAEL